MNVGLLFRSRPLRLLVGLVVLVWLLTVELPHSWPLGIVLIGVVSGASSGLLALGLVLTYRSCKVINFAYGAMGSVAAEVGVVAYQEHHLPWGVCVGLALVAGLVVGAIVDLIMRRFANAPRLVATVATIGLMQVLIGLQFAIGYWSHAFLLVSPFTNGLSRTHSDIGGSFFTGNDLLAVVLAPIGLAALSYFLLRTRSGTAVRAMSDNTERAQLLGIPIHRLSRVVWLLVSFLAAAVMIFNAPTNGLPSTPFVFAGGVFMPALAAAVIARMEDLPTAFFAGVALGVLDSVVSYNVHKEALTTVALVVVVLAALLIRKWPTTRADADGTSWSLSAPRRPLPPAIAHLPEVRFGRGAVLVVLGAAAMVFPLLAGPGEIHTVAGYVIWGIGALSLVVLAGWSGTISLGQIAIFGVGAVTAGDLIVKQNVDLFLALAAGGLVGAVVTVLIGLPALRVRPIFLAVTTLVFAGAMDQYVLNPSNYPNRIPTTILRPVLWKRFPLHSERATYYLCLVVLMAVVLLVRAMQKSRPSRVLQAGRDNRKATAALGVSVLRTQVAGTFVAGLFAGVAGGLWAVLQEGVGSSSFSAQDGLTLFSMAVVGGLGSIYGSLSGVALSEAVVYLISRSSSQGAQFSTIGTGALLLGILIIFPGGLGQAIENVRDRIAKQIAARRGINLEVGAAAGSLTVVGSEPDDASSTPERRVVAAQSMLSCRDLVASYGPLQVLFGVDIEVAEGEIVALLGTNGAGKSTIFRAITALLVSRGEISFDGASLNGMTPDMIARTGLAMMPGGRGIFPSLSVAENLQLACWQLRGDRQAAQAAENAMLEMFPVIRTRARLLAGNLSGGEQQQLSLAMAFATRPKLLLIDELSLGLAPTVVEHLCERVREIHQAGTTIIVVEQSVNVALRVADRAIFLEKGAVRFEGATTELLERPDLLRSVFIGQIGAQPGAPELTHGIDQESPAKDVTLVCEDITKRFGGITALDRIDLDIQPGRIVGLIGHNGAGKTTLFDVISGFQQPDDGRILLGDVDITAHPPHQRAIAGLGRSFQEARLFPSLTVMETVTVALDRHLASRDWLAAALTAPPSIDSELSAHERAEELCELLGLADFATTPVSDLSTGTRRIVELACVMAADPAVLLLDEPSAGVAQKDTEALAPLLRRAQADTGCAILIIEHDMALLSGLCDELVALEQGAVICRGTPSEVLTHARVIDSYLGTEVLTGRSNHRQMPPALLKEAVGKGGL